MTIANSTSFSYEGLSHLCSRPSSMTIRWTQEDNVEHDQKADDQGSEQ
jgi:hypothetical protein